MKEKLGATNALYPLVTAIVGATVDGRPDFATIAHVGIAHLKGITLGMGNVHLTNKGIIENGTFSVNLPSEDLVGAHRPHRHGERHARRTRATSSSCSTASSTPRR